MSGAIDPVYGKVEISLNYDGSWLTKTFTGSEAPKKIFKTFQPRLVAKPDLPSGKYNKAKRHPTSNPWRSWVRASKKSEFAQKTLTESFILQNLREPSTFSTSFKRKHRRHPKTTLNSVSNAIKPF